MSNVVVQRELEADEKYWNKQELGMEEKWSERERCLNVKIRGKNHTRVLKLNFKLEID